MFAALRELIGQLRSLVEQLDGTQLEPEECARLVETLAEAERICAAGRSLVATRASKAWQRGGHRSPAAWMADVSGTSVGHAARSIETARRLDELPATRAAFRAGLLSETQVAEIASSATPQTEARLLHAARERSLAGLREECRRVVAARDQGAERVERLRRSRSLRHWTDPDGAVRLDARLPPEDGAEVVAVLDRYKDRAFRAARKAGRHEPYAAYAADALVALARAASSDREGGDRPRPTVHVMVDHAALARGAVTGDERCEIPGIGPIPVASARAMLSDSFLKLLVTDGIDITAVAHAGRTIPARVRTALEARDETCVVPGCDARKGLEIDHYRIAFADGGPSSLDNLARVCRWHHYLKTHCGYQLSGGPGSWAWRTPDDLEGMQAATGARPPPAA